MFNGGINCTGGGVIDSWQGILICWGAGRTGVGGAPIACPSNCAGAYGDISIGGGGGNGGDTVCVGVVMGVTLYVWW